MNFQKEVEDHMALYKTNCDDSDLRKIKANGIYKNKTDYKHILPVTDPSALNIFGSGDNIRKLNLLPAFRESCWSYLQTRKAALNTYFHHLNSSQGMCFNFFYPFASDPNLLSLIMRTILDDRKVKLTKPMDYKFEYSSYVDKTQYSWDKPTNFDFYVSSPSHNFFFEIKYKESSFSEYTKNTNKNRALKYESMYKALANEVIVEDKNNPVDFLRNYQIMRNLVHLKKDTNRDNYVIIVYPERNSVVARKASESHNLLLPQYKNNLITISWEFLFLRSVDELMKIDKYNGLIKEQLTEFKKKYLFWL